MQFNNVIWKYIIQVYFKMQSDDEILNSIWKSYNNKNRINILSHFLSAFI